MFGDVPGPVTPGTRNLYERRLVKMMQTPSLPKLGKTEFQPELLQALNGKLDESFTQDLEYKMMEPFENPDPACSWREGTRKNSFNYLSLDPHVSKNLPARVKTLGEEESFRVFVHSIFYVGKEAIPGGHQIKERAR